MYFFNALAWTSTNPLALFVSGPVGMAAAAAVATGKKRKRPHIFESNPSIRKRQQTRLLRSAALLRPLCDPSSPTDIIYVAWKYISSRLRTYRLACVCFQEAASHPGWVHDQSGPAGHCAVHLPFQTQPRVQGFWRCPSGERGELCQQVQYTQGFWHAKSSPFTALSLQSALYTALEILCNEK